MACGEEKESRSPEDIGFTFIASVVSRIQWTAVPKEASGIYQCRDSNDVSQSTSNATLIVANSSQHYDGRFHGRIQDQENKVPIFQRGERRNTVNFFYVKDSPFESGPFEQGKDQELLHGDLAARHVLLADDKIVNIVNFIFLWHA
ncbi:hypothetical protein DAPPUDRAFT_252881 [Daphnia pulex]|uniref:Ig-like domain-containing protein n=1 Tax=Daphnia pulex TaxID=6669 RepID=E9H3P3_DAPPU|nr:hypothetical protein DAPPUDRAFT_252881 [Daphnia pulex]|eukprot:EFX73544.1 hypothetical protein DAPPUDRAFT_252881 [Daphnia pulex]